MNKLHLKFVFILSGMSNLPLELRMWSNKVQPSNTHINLNCHAWPKKGIDTGQCWKQIRLRFRHCWIWLINAKQRMNYNYNTIEFCKLRVLKASGSSCLEEPSPGATLLPANETNPLFHNCLRLWATIAGNSPTGGHCRGQARLWVGKQVAGVVLVVNEFYFQGKSNFAFAYCSFQIISCVHGVRSDSISFKWSW